MKSSRLLFLLAAVSLVGCGGGGGGGSSSINPAASGGGSGSGGAAPDPVAASSPASGSSFSELLSSQFSGSINSFQAASSLPGGQEDGREVYAPDTESSLTRAFVQTGRGDVVAGRSSSAFLIGSTAYGVAQAAQDFLVGAGVAADGYTFIDTNDRDVSNRSAYLRTPENSLVNILSNPLYTSGSGGLEGLIISPDDITDHGWIVSDTGFNGNIDPIAGISGQGWLGEHADAVAEGYRQALDTGKVRLFYGLNVDGQTRHSTSNGCQGAESHCIGTPYSLRVRNGQGRYTDVEGTLVGTYGFAAYVMAWERMDEDTHISEVFELGDECTVDLGVAGADADTGLGRLDIGCLATRVYESHLPPAEVAEPEVEPEPVPVDPEVTPAVEPDPVPPVSIAVNPPPVYPEPEPAVSIVVQPPVEPDPEPAVSIVVQPPVEPDPEPAVSIVVQPPVEPDPEPAVSIVVQPPVEPDPEPAVSIVVQPPVEPDPEPAVSIVVQPPVEPDPEVTLPDAEENQLETDLVQVDHWGTDIEKRALLQDFDRLGLATAISDRKDQAFHIEHRVYAWSYEEPFEHWLKYYEQLRMFHNKSVDVRSGLIEDLLSGMGIHLDVSYAFILAGDWDHDANYDHSYKRSSENSLVHFETNPFYLGGPRAWSYWGWDQGMDKETWLDADLIQDYGWILSETGYDGQHIVSSSYPWRYHHAHTKIVDYRKADQSNSYPEHQAQQRRRMESNYETALATGKVRVFYGLNGNHSGRDPKFHDCTDFEEYCIGVPYPYNSQYAFGVYVASWERLPQETHISAVFAMGDRCTEDLGAAGPDSDTGLGRLDIGCMAYEVYKINLDPESATLSVAARIRESEEVGTLVGNPLVTVTNEGDLNLQLHSVQLSSAGASDGPSQQQFFDDFAQELFSDLGSLWLPGSTQAGFSVGFPGDSFEGTYRPTHGTSARYEFEPPSPRYALAGGSVGVMGTSAGEIGIFTRIEGMDVSFSYARSDDFFGGQGSGDFAFSHVGNSRLMVQRQLLPGSGDHSLVVGGWLRHAAVAGGRGRLLDDLRGFEHGLSVSYDWKREDGLRVEATAHAARFAGGDVGLAGERFAIGASDWQWGVGIRGSYQF